MRIRINRNPLSGIHEYPKLDSTKLFAGFAGKIDFEIGFGLSSFLIDRAQTHPDHLVVGIDVLKKAVACMREKVALTKNENIQILYGNGVACLKDMFEDQSVDTIFIFHPTPWIKRRHVKRRIINHDFLLIAEKKLKLGGRIYVSTDVEEMWLQISDSFTAHPQFTPIKDDNFWQNFYSTRWHEMSVAQNRSLFSGVFELR